MTFDRAGSAPSPAPADAIDPAILDRLLRRREPATIESLAQAAGQPPQVLMAQMELLRRAGCQLTIEPHRGISLVASGLGCWVDYLRWALPDGASRPIELYRQTASTQDAARRLIEARGAAADRAIVIADEQSAGRGRLGRKWVSPPGAALMFSRVVILPAADTSPSIDRLVFATSVAAARAVEIAAAPRWPKVHIKWPNDLIVDGRKLAGILVEAAPLPSAPAPGGVAAVIGLGVNVHLHPEQIPADPPELRHRITSLAMLGCPVDRLLLLTELIRQIDAALTAPDVTPLLDEWRHRSLVLAKPIRLLSSGQFIEGQVIDLDPHAGLIVRTTAGQTVLLPSATTTVL